MKRRRTSVSPDYLARTVYSSSDFMRGSTVFVMENGSGLFHPKSQSFGVVGASREHRNDVGCGRFAQRLVQFLGYIYHQYMRAKPSYSTYCCVLRTIFRLYCMHRAGGRADMGPMRSRIAYEVNQPTQNVQLQTYHTFVCLTLACSLHGCEPIPYGDRRCARVRAAVLLVVIEHAARDRVQLAAAVALAVAGVDGRASGHGCVQGEGRQLASSVGSPARRPRGSVVTLIMAWKATLEAPSVSDCTTLSWMAHAASGCKRRKLSLAGEILPPDANIPVSLNIFRPISSLLNE